MATKEQLTMANTVDYQGFSEISGLSVPSLRVYSRREDFPAVVSPDWARSPPRFRKNDVLAWSEAREVASRDRLAKATGKAKGGRPLATQAKIRLDEKRLAKLRERLKVKKITMVQLANEFGVTRRAIAQRLEGLSGWDEAQLRRVAELLGVRYETIVGR